MQEYTHCECGIEIPKVRKRPEHWYREYTCTCGLVWLYKGSGKSAIKSLNYRTSEQNKCIKSTTK